VGGKMQGILLSVIYGLLKLLKHMMTRFSTERLRGWSDRSQDKEQNCLLVKSSAQRTDYVRQKM